jgi:hypothetical protein
MKVFFLLTLFISFSSFAHTESRDLFISANGPKIPKKRFNTIVNSVEKLFAPYAEKDGRELEIFTDYDADWAQGFARRWETDQVHIYGGLAALPDGTEDVFALVLCHELGHLYGGHPFTDEYNRMAVEGQADYWASLECFSQILPLLEHREGTVAERGSNAALVLTAFFADNRNIPHPDLRTPDTSVVTQVLKTHPSPQCRLDTYLAGLFSLSRPECWMPGI